MIQSATDAGTDSACPPVLLIEDEPAVTALVCAVLEGHGFAVVPTESGAEALRLLEYGDFHGVISDMRTPGEVDGAQMHAWISIHRPEFAERQIFITGDIANEEAAATLRRTGAPYVEKPFRVHDFITVVENTLGKAAL
jgi:DNA-binding NtrC family response regulator